MNDPLAIDLFNFDVFEKALRKESGTTREYLELYKYIRDADAFESSNGDMEVLNMKIDRKAIMKFPQYASVIKNNLPLNSILTIQEAFAAISAISSKTGIPVGKTKQSTKKYLHRFCRWEEANTKHSKGVKILGY